jgi:hypothetical protein
MILTTIRFYRSTKNFFWNKIHLHSLKLFKVNTMAKVIIDDRKYIPDDIGILIYRLKLINLQ